MSPRVPVAVSLALMATACPSKSHPVKQPPPPDQSGPVDLAALQADQAVHGFHVGAVYLDGAGLPMGGRFVHDATGFVLDYLRVESAPQGFIWINTFPTTDQGEPHTQEHLLLGKGDRGRAFGNFQSMALAESSAFTDQYRTCYHFHTVAAKEVFWPVFADQLDGLLNPDYTDEEIRREVSNFGVSQDPDGSLRLEEKGTVYNEMVRTYESPDNLVWRAADRMMYGATHPLARSSGGYPDDIRTMSPADIRSFHEKTHYLGNMGMIGSFPSSMELGGVLDETAAILDKLAGRTGDAMQPDQVPAPSGVAPGSIELVDYPYADAGKASPVMLMWPPTRELSLDDRTLLELFLSAVAGDESTTLYKELVDGKTRTIDVGATGVWAYVRADFDGLPIYLGVEGVSAASLTADGVEQIRATVHDVLGRIAALPPGDPELMALRERMLSRLADTRRSLAKFLNSPPGFGYRGTSGAWMAHLMGLESVPDFKKSLTLAPQLASVEQVLDEGGNPWTARLKAWGLLATPLGVAARPSPETRAALDRDRQARIAAEVARLGTVYGLEGDQEILTRYGAEYDASTVTLESSAKAAAMPPFVDTPPMTQDDQLEYEITQVEGVPLVASTIDSMTGGTVAVAFRLDAVAEDELPYLAMLPTLLTESGLWADGVATPSEEVKEALRREILSLSMYYDSNPASGRVELVVSGAGTDLAETRRALEWIAKLTSSPDWRVDNLARLRDVVDQSIQGYRNIMGGAEEGWVTDPPSAYWRQRWPLFAHTSSFLTKQHDLHRLRWMLLGGGDGKAIAIAAKTLTKLAGGAGKLGRVELEALASTLEDPAKKPAKTATAHATAWAKLPAEARALLTEAGKDLRAIMGQLPDDSLAADWAYLCKQMAADLTSGPADALAHLDSVRRAVLDAGNARAWLVASSGNGKSLRNDLGDLLAALAHAEPARRTYSDAPFIHDRLRARQPAAKEPVFVGLVNPNTSSGVFVHTAPGAHYTDTSDDALLDYLAANLYTGHGGHSMFMKTWAAGLAYSNGLRISLGQGRVNYYAERCPELPQTMRFVIEQLNKAKVDPSLVDYAVAESFSSRVAASYEGRAASIAADLEDGVTPDVVRAFRTKLLALRERDGLAADLFARMERVYGQVLPGYGPTKAKDVADAVYFTTGPHTQLDAWADYLAAVEGKDAVLYRLYPRDFWVPAAVK